MMTNEQRLQAVETLRQINHSIALLDSALSPQGKAMQAELIERANAIHKAIAAAS